MLTLCLWMHQSLQTNQSIQAPSRTSTSTRIIPLNTKPDAPSARHRNMHVQESLTGRHNAIPIIFDNGALEPHRVEIANGEPTLTSVGNYRRQDDGVRPLDPWLPHYALLPTCALPRRQFARKGAGVSSRMPSCKHTTSGGYDRLPQQRWGQPSTKH